MYRLRDGNDDCEAEMKHKGLLINLLGWGLCAVAAAAILFYMLRVNQSEQLHYEQLTLEAEERAEALEEERAEIARMKTYFRDFLKQLSYGNYVFWSDTDMQGDKGYSIPSLFTKVSGWETQDYLKEKLGEPYAKETGGLTMPAATVYDMSVTNETLNEILVRAGSNPLEVAEQFEIPADPEPVNISLRNGKSGEDLRFAMQRTSRLGTVMISGVLGVLTDGEGEYDEYHPILAFKRNESENELKVAEGTTFELESASLYLKDIPIIFMDDTEDLVEREDINRYVSDLQGLVERYAGNNAENGNNRYYVIICTTDEGSMLDTKLKDAFGSCYIQNPTPAELMTQEGCTTLATMVYENLDKQGCFAEIKEKITKRIVEFREEKDVETYEEHKYNE